MIKTYNKYISPLLLLTIATVALVFLWSQSFRVSQLELSESWKKHTQETNEKNELLSDYLQEIGYGGFIHNFKNYILRQDDSYAEKLEANVDKIFEIENKLVASLTSSEEASQFNSIQKTVHEYIDRFRLAQFLIKEGTTTSDLDELMRVDDLPATQAIHQLQIKIKDSFKAGLLDTEKLLIKTRNSFDLGIFILLPILLLAFFIIYIIRALDSNNQLLTKQTANTELILNTTPESVISVNKKGRIITANYQAINYFGYGIELIGKMIEELVPQEIGKSHVNYRMEYFKSPSNRNMGQGRKIQCVLASGERRRVEINLGCAEDKDGDAIVVVCLRDIENEYASNQLIRDYQTRVSVASKLSKIGFWEYELDTKQVKWDPSCFALFDVSSTEPITLPMWRDTILDEQKDEFDLYVTNAKENVSFVLNTDVLTFNSTKKTIRTMGLVVRSEQRLKIIGAFDDITAEIEIIRQLEQSKILAESANEFKDQFLANMSHEIRTPMNAILGTLTLLEDMEFDSRNKRLVSSAYVSAQTLLQILDDILDFSKLEAGKLEIAEDPFSLNNVIDRSLDLFSIVAASKSLGLKLDVKADVHIDLIGDELRLGQVLNNLMSNAIKFTDEGYIKLSVESIQADADSCLLRFSVSDTGVGIKTENISEIIKSFSQGDMKTTRRFGGTGLGLSICNSLLGLMGTELNLSSVVNKGSIVSFDINFALPSDSKRYMDLRIEKKSAVICSDDPELKGQLIQYLNFWQVETSVTESSNALKNILSGEPHINVIIFHASKTNKVNEYFQIIDDYSARCESTPLVILVGDIRTINVDKIKESAYSILSNPPTPSRLFDLINTSLPDFQTKQTGKAIDMAQTVTSHIRGARILIAEDVYTNQLILTDFLEMLGMSVEIVENGLEAARRVKTETYDAILMDFHMPVMNGLESTEEIRKFNQHIPIIAVTAAAFEKDKKAALKAGMNAHISKPINIYELAKSLADWVQVSKTTPVTAPQNSTPVNSKLSFDDFSFENIKQHLDVSAVQYGFGHNPELYLKCLHMFSQDFAAWSEDAKNLGDNKKYKELTKAAHKLKGACLNLHAVDLGEKARIVEESARQGQTNGLNSLAQELARFRGRINKLAEPQTIDQPSEMQSNEIVIVNGDNLTNEISLLLEKIKKQVYFDSDELQTIFNSFSSQVDSELLKRLTDDLSKFEYSNAQSILENILENKTVRKNG